MRAECNDYRAVAAKFIELGDTVLNEDGMDDVVRDIDPHPGDDPESKFQMGSDGHWEKFDDVDTIFVKARF